MRPILLTNPVLAAQLEVYYLIGASNIPSNEFLRYELLDKLNQLMSLKASIELELITDNQKPVTNDVL